MKRSVAIGILVSAAMTGIVLAADKPRLTHDGAQPIAVTARVLPHFQKSGSDHSKFGALTWRGGIELSSPSRHFGGWSGLRVSPDGTRLLAVSDAGVWMRGDIAYEKSKPIGLERTFIAPLKALSGQKLRRTRDRDAEAIALLSGTLKSGKALIAFEQNDRVGIFAIAKGQLKKPARYLKLPSLVRNKLGRDGVEALTVFKGGRYKGAILFFLEETKDARGDHHGWLMHKGRASPIWLKDIGGFAVTDCVGLSDGSIVVLERRFRWSEGVKMRLRRLKGADIKPGARLVGETLLEADMGYQIDNMEGVAAHRDENGTTVLTLISDNNFNPFLQRTVLLQFALAEKKPRRSVSNK